jgi:hypothetical protein
MHISEIAFVCGYFLLIWLRTNAFAEYMTLFRLSWLFRIEEYNKLAHESYPGNYVDFLAEYYRAFFIVRLIICPVCVSFWTGVLSTPFLSFEDSAALAPLTLLFYTLFNKML